MRTIQLHSDTPASDELFCRDLYSRNSIPSLRPATSTEGALEHGLSVASWIHAFLSRVESETQLGDVCLASDAPMPEDNDDYRTGRIELDLLVMDLSDPTRRSILMRLAGQDPRDGDESAIDDLDAEDDRVELLEAEVTYHHLPQLDRAGILEWDRDSGTITPGPNFERVRPLIDLIRTHQDELPEEWL